MRMREENPPDPKCTQSFTATFEWYRDTKYPGLFADVGDGKTIPTLGQVRGKVVVLQDYDYAPFWGLRYITPGSNPPFNSQDDYVVAFSKAGFDAKWSAIYRHLYLDQCRRPHEDLVRELSERRHADRLPTWSPGVTPRASPRSA